MNTDPRHCNKADAAWHDRTCQLQRGHDGECRAMCSRKIKRGHSRPMYCARLRGHDGACQS